MRKRNIILSLISILLAANLNAQDFDWQAKVNAVDKDAFYKILVSPDITSKMQNGFNDIRVFSGSGKEVPYIFETEKRLQYNDYFVEYKIIEKQDQNKWPYYTRLVIHNPKRESLTNIQLVIRNSDVSKKLKLNGSDDKEKWYVIKDSYRFHAIYSDENTSVIRIIDFPKSNYEYFEILIDDWRNKPINIQKAGFFNSSVDEGKYSIVKSPVINQIEKEKEKESLVKIVFEGKPQIDKITFKINGPDFYYREAELQIKDSVKNKKKEYEYFFNTIDRLVLSSNSTNSFYIDGLRTDAIYLRIVNKDNEPLGIDSIIAEQLNSYLICQLPKGKYHMLKFGNGQLNAPEYDLKYFKDEVPADAKILVAGALKSIQNGDDSDSKKGIHLDNIYIWIAIIVVLAFLVYMITKMMKDMKKEQK